MAIGAVPPCYTPVSRRQEIFTVVDHSNPCPCVGGTRPTTLRARRALGCGFSCLAKVGYLLDEGRVVEVRCRRVCPMPSHVRKGDWSGELSCQYFHLSPLVRSGLSVREGEQGGEQASARGVPPMRALVQTNPTANSEAA